MGDEPIHSARNPRLLAARKLRERKHRTQQGRFLIDGTRELARAVAAGVELVEVFACEPMLADQASRELLPQIERLRAPIHRVSPQVFGKLAYGDRAEGIVAVAVERTTSLGDLTLSKDALVAVLERCEKPGNLGAVLRSADAAGVAAVVLADPLTDVFNPNAIRASLGTIFTVPVAVGTSDEVKRWLRDKGMTIYAARVDARQGYTQVDLTRASAIVLGNEARGLTDIWLGGDVVDVRLPMRGIADSLNVSVTAAVMFYEALRQRRQEST